MATAQDKVVRFPTDRKAAYRNPVLRTSELPDGVVPIRRPRIEGAPPPVRSVEMAVLLAVIGAMPTKQRAAVRGQLFRKAYDTPGDDILYAAYELMRGVL
jgi:hypothetical protein